MIESFTKAWFANLPTMRENFAKKHPGHYRDIVAAVVHMLADHCGDLEKPDPERIHEIGGGKNFGTLLYVIAEQGYQPSKYWYVKVEYGSCSACDTLERIKNYDNGKPTSEQVENYMTLALHIVQGMKVLGDD